MIANAQTDKKPKKPKKPKYPKVPSIESDFLIFFTNLMLIKTMLFKFGYAEYWTKWDFYDLIDSAFLLMVRGYEV